MVIRNRGAVGFLIMFLALTARGGGMLATPGTFSVSQSGAATYTVPIETPPGTAGTAPHLSLNYSSQSNNGVAGAGWSLGGFSSITRCPSTTAVDGARVAIYVNASDKLCLDGQRLISQSGAYGATGATYYTELFNGAQVTQTTATGATIGTAVTVPTVTTGSAYVPINHQTATTLPYLNGTTVTPIYQASTPAIGSASFQVRTKSGELMEYVPSDLCVGTTCLPRSWLLARITDAAHNYWVVSYYENWTTGEVLPISVAYTGNASATNTAGTSTPLYPYNFITFVYQPRSDPAQAFLAGGPIGNFHRLAAVQTWTSVLAPPTGLVANGAAATLVKEYRLGYDGTANVLSAKSRLTTITECDTASDSANRASQVCLNPTSFAYSEMGSTSGSFTAQAYTGPNFAATNASVTFAGDIDGDGLPDLAAYTGTTLTSTYISRGNTFIPGPSVTSGVVASAPYAVMLDLNGDGFSDLLTTTAGTNAYTSACYTGANIATGTAGAFSQCTLFTPTNYYPNAVAADFDGDGVTDFLFYVPANASTNSYWNQCVTSVGVANYATQRYCVGVYEPGNQPATTSPTLVPPTTYVGDFNGDGMADYAYIANSVLYVCISNGFSATCSAWAGPTAGGQSAFVADMNGDGLADFVSYVNSTWQVCLSTGISFSCSNWAANASPTQNLVGDFNGDGLADIAGWQTGNVWEVCLSTGSSFNCNTWSGPTGPVITGTTNNFLVADFNGDGVSDIFAKTGGPGGGSQLWLNQISRPDTLTTITNGVGVNTSIVTSSILTTPNYSKPGAAYQLLLPERILNVPLSVVTSVSADNATGSQNTTEYWYSTLTARNDGRGPLGFSQMMSQDMTTTGNIQVTTFNKTWPFIGMTSLSATCPGKASSPGIVINPNTSCFSKTSVTSFGSQQPTGAACASGKSCIAFVGGTLKEGWDLDGTALPKKSTTVLVDNFGNTTQQVVTVLDNTGAQTGYVTKNTNTFVNITLPPVANPTANPPTWQLGRLIQSTVTSETP